MMLTQATKNFRRTQNGIAWDAYRVLLIEDNPADVQLLRHVMHGHGSHVGFDIVDVPRLSDALDILAHEKFDLIILDLNLRDSYSADSVIQIRASHPRNVPIVVYTDSADDQLRDEALHYGANEYFLKQTADAHTMRAAIMKVLETETPHSDPGPAAGPSSRVVQFLKSIQQDLRGAYDFGTLNPAANVQALYEQGPAPVRILVVEDSHADFVLSRQALTASAIPHSVERLKSGKDVIPYLKQHAADPPDLMLLDLGLPDVDGFRLLEDMSELPPHTRSVPIVITTNYVGFDYLQNSHPNLCIYGYMPKPIAPVAIKQIVEENIAPHTNEYS